MKNLIYILTIVLIALGLNGCGASKMQIAVAQGNISALENEISRGGNIYETTDTGLTLLSLASSRGNMKIIQYLVENGVNVNAISENGITALTEATITNQIQVVKYLLSKGANIHSRLSSSSFINEAYRGKNALEIAQMNGNDEIIVLLTNQR